MIGTGPVWRAARAAVRRRRAQTAIIGVVLLFSTASIVVALALMVASSAPFDRAFSRSGGAHLVAAFDPDAAPAAALAATAKHTGVVAAAGPFGQVVVDVPELHGPGLGSGPVTVVGRAEPGGPVDRIDIWRGRWATGAGEIVLNAQPAPDGFGDMFPLGRTVPLPGGEVLTVVGYAYSLTGTADAWVSPAQMTALRPTATQMLYRFAEAGTAEEIRSNVDSLIGGLPDGALLGSQSYLVVKKAAASQTGPYVPFLMAFGVLGVCVAILIVANVVSGAVVSGYRHIGVLKALGFTPRQVVAVYLVMVCVPGAIGAAVGTLAGHVTAGLLLTDTFQGVGLGEVTVSPWVDAAALLGMPAVVALAALAPALRAHRLSAAEAISAGSAPHAGRGLSAHRRLSGTRLPRPVSLGLGLPFARPARTALTTAAVLLGVTTVTFATGLTATLIQFSEIADRNDHEQVMVRPNNPNMRFPGEPATGPSDLTDPQIEALLRTLPGTAHVTANLGLDLSVAGYTRDVTVAFLRGDAGTLGLREQLIKGRWLQGPGEVVVASEAFNELDLAVGQRIMLERDGRRASVTIVGEIMDGGTGGPGLLTAWETLALVDPDYRPQTWEIGYQIQVVPGTDVPSYVSAIEATGHQLDAWDQRGTNDFSVIMISLATVLTLMLGTVAALGVFNTVVLNTRERRRDLGMLKSIGMTPRQVIAMMITSMAALGAVGGLLGIPVGVVAHRLIVPIAADAANVDLPRGLLDVWGPQQLTLLALAGVLIAVLGALLPARSAARLPIAEVLHNE